MPAILLTNRSLAMLRAVAAGRADLGAGSEPDLRVDGLPCCDQPAAHRLFHDGLVRPAGPARPGQWTPAELTAAGELALGLPAAA
ncbi:hypothetical protein [Amycolatopsis sp. NBC_01480]|jgi:hypothetical protein|uniref:hypothetical protein n=1 Tax=Amycolatopsis sp. NBC_01480 TaxID=2903562 RepID=UPI002E2D6223|nr:hypothetical protein [Amycolatopsis sp. NBC_01480]